jgi:hypothetical protein
MTDDPPPDRSLTEEAARTGEFPNATGDAMDDSNPVAGGGAASDDAQVGGESAARYGAGFDRGVDAGQIGSPGQGARPEDEEDATPPDEADGGNA